MLSNSGSNTLLAVIKNQWNQSAYEVGFPLDSFLRIGRDMIPDAGYFSFIVNFLERELNLMTVEMLSSSKEK